jgi:hypothetical protein
VLTIHPGWEVLLWLNGWKGKKDTKLERFWPLSYPYYFSYSDDEHYAWPGMSPGALDADTKSSAEKKYQEALKQFSVYAVPKDFVAEYQKETAKWDKKQKCRRISTLIKEWWGGLSNVEPPQDFFCTLCYPPPPCVC